MSSMMPNSASIDPACVAGSGVSWMDLAAIDGMNGGRSGEPPGLWGSDLDAIIATAPDRLGRQPWTRG